jgi:proteasome lid subunit RPN8/RPN11
MLAQAISELPNECCGLLGGHLLTESCQQIAQVERRYPLKNAAASPVEYTSEPYAMFDAMRDLHRLQLEIVGVYHSHPTSPPVPSKKDLERNYDPKVVNVIVSLQEIEPLVRVWWLNGHEFREAQWEITPS